MQLQTFKLTIPWQASESPSRRAAVQPYSHAGEMREARPQGTARHAGKALS